MWLVPYRFVQKVTGDVDFRIMGTFVQFYTTLLGFINFRLYTSIGLVYPPKFDVTSDERGAELAAFKLEGRKVGETNKAIEPRPEQANKKADGSQESTKEIQAKVDTVLKKADLDKEPEPEQGDAQENSNDAIDSFEPTAPEADTLPQPQISGDEAATLFAPYTFFISREAPRPPLEFLLRAFGCRRVGWDSVLGDGAFTHDEADTRITHQIVDRPPLPESALPPLPQNPEAGSESAPRIRPGTRVPGRTYVQPQWVWDCVNEGKLLRPDLYAPGATLPPHLSPWVKPTRGGYDPRAPLEEQEHEGEAERVEEDEEDESESEEAENEEEPEDSKSKPHSKKADVSQNGAKVSDEEAESEEESTDGGMDVDLSDDDSEESEDNKADDFGGFDDEGDQANVESEEEDEAAQNQHQRELEAEAAGLPFSASDGNSAKTKQSKDGKGSKKQTPLSKKHAAQKKKEEEELERQKMMMSRKKRKLFDKMQYSNKKRDDESEKLRQKRRKLEKGKK